MSVLGHNSLRTRMVALCQDARRAGYTPDEIAETLRLVRSEILQHGDIPALDATAVVDWSFPRFFDGVASRLKVALATLNSEKARDVIVSSEDLFVWIGRAMSADLINFDVDDRNIIFSKPVRDCFINLASAYAISNNEKKLYWLEQLLGSIEREIVLPDHLFIRFEKIKNFSRIMKKVNDLIGGEGGVYRHVLAESFKLSQDDVGLLCEILLRFGRVEIKKKGRYRLLQPVPDHVRRVGRPSPA